MPSMRVRLHGVISKYVSYGENEFEISLPEASTIRDLITKLGIPHDEVWLVVVDGSRTEPTSALKGGSVIELLSPVVGG